MPPPRRNPPLFDLVSGGASPPKAPTGVPRAAEVDIPEAPPARPAKPVMRVELKPRENPEPAPRAVESPRPERAASPRPSPMVGGPAVRIGQNIILIALAVVVGLLVLAYITGYRSGRTAAERELAAFQRQNPGVNEPLPAPQGSTPPPTQGSASPAPRQTAPPRPAPTPAPTGSLTGEIPAGATITSRGYLQGDLRESGLNYLTLAVLSGEDARAAILFLSQNGVEAFAVPVDPSGRPANNRGPSYRLFALPGITSEQYRQRQTVRTRLEAEVARLGGVWQREHRGASNFARTQWEKYD